MNEETTHEASGESPLEGTTTDRQLPYEDENASQTVEVEAKPAKEPDDSSSAGSMLKLGMPAPRSGAPFWAMLPPGMKFPRNRQIIFLRFKSSLTDTPMKGFPMPVDDSGTLELDKNGKPVLYRQCICWSTNVAEQRMAAGRARQDSNLFVDELAQQMIRACDGQAVDWSGAEANGIEQFWNEIGKCRGLVHRVYSTLHVVDREALHDFLANGIVVVSSV